MAAKTKTTVKGRVAKAKKKGVAAKAKTSTTKTSKKYKKPYAGQGR